MNEIIHQPKNSNSNSILCSANVSRKWEDTSPAIISPGPRGQNKIKFHMGEVIDPVPL